MKCSHCNGAGQIDNPKYWTAKSDYPRSDYYLSFETTLKCKACKGAGYIVANIKDILDILRGVKARGAINKLEKEDIDNLQKCIDLIETK